MSVAEYIMGERNSMFRPDGETRRTARMDSSCEPVQ